MPRRSLEQEDPDVGPEASQDKKVAVLQKTAVELEGLRMEVEP